MKNLRSWIKISFKEILAYKFEVLLWLIVTPVSLAVYYFLWSSIYAHTGQDIIRGFTLSELLSYFVLIEIVSFIVWSNADTKIARGVRSGNLVVKLVRPTKIYTNFLLYKLGRLLFFIPINTPPLILIGIYFFGLKIVSLTYFGLFIISIILAMLLFYTFVFLLGISSFWLKEYSGIGLMKQGLIWFLGGGILPIVFFPEIAQKIIAFLPFHHMLYTPVQIFLGNFTMLEIYSMLAVQIVWIVLLYIFIQIAWKKAMLKFSGVGV